MTGSQRWEDNLPNIFGDAAIDFLVQDQALAARTQQMIYESAYREFAEVMGDQLSDPPPPEAEFRARVAKYLEDNGRRLREEICVKFDYCRKRKEYAARSNRAAFLLALAVFLFDIKCGGLATATWVLTTGELDRFCGCSEQIVPK